MFNLATRILHHKSLLFTKNCLFKHICFNSCFFIFCTPVFQFGYERKVNDFFKILMGKHMQRANNLWVITERILLTWNWMNKGLVVCAVQRTSS